jgi:hypothetical protein
VSGGLALLGWSALRMFGVLRMQVMWRSAVGPMWEAISITLAICMALVLWPTSPIESVPLSRWLAIAACELLLGSVLGGLLSLPGAALLGAVDHGAAVLQQPRSRGLPLLLTIACLAGGLLAGVHRPLLLALRELSTVWPVGAPARWLPGLDTLGAPLVPAAHACLVLALTFATPVLLTAATLDLGLRLAARGVAVAPVEAVRPWLVAAAAMVALGAAWAAYPEAWQRAWPQLP